MKDLNILIFSLKNLFNIIHNISEYLDQNTLDKFNIEQKKIVDAVNSLHNYFYPRVEYPWKQDEKFAEAWGMWKIYKKQEFNFTYKSDISEQSALQKLANISKGNLSTAIDIIIQSIENGWQGLFPIKQNETTNRRAQNSQYKQELFERLTRNHEKY